MCLTVSHAVCGTAKSDMQDIPMIQKSSVSKVGGQNTRAERDGQKRQNSESKEEMMTQYTSVVLLTIIWLGCIERERGNRAKGC